MGSFFVSAALGAIALVATGCSGNGAGDSGDGEPSRDVTTPAEVETPSSGTLVGGGPGFRAFIHIFATANDANPQTVPFVIEVQLGVDGAPLRGANVVAGALHQPLAAHEIVAGDYIVQSTGYPTWFETSIQTSGLALNDVRLRAPALHRTWISHNQGRGQPAKVAWAPNHEDAIRDVRLQIFDTSAQRVTYDVHVADAGEAEIPAGALVRGSTSIVQIKRSTSLDLAIPSSTAIVELTSSVSLVTP